MAVNLGSNTKKENTANNNSNVNNGASVNSNNDNNVNNSTGASKTGKVLTFGNVNMGLMSSGLGSEYLKTFLDMMSKIYKADIGGDNNYTIFAIDNAVYTTLSYSHIVTAVVKNNTVVYHIVTLEATGNESSTAISIANELNAPKMGGYMMPRPIYVTADTVTNTVHELVIGKLKGILKSNNFDFIPVDALVVPNGVMIEESTIKPIAAISYNACVIELGLMTEEFLDINIREANKQSQGTMLKNEVSFVKTTAYDAVGKPVRTDWTVKMFNVANKQQMMNMPNNNDQKVLVCETSGFIDSVITIIDGNQNGFNMGYNQPAISRLCPMIVCNNITVSKQTTGNLLLGVVSGIIMTRPTMYFNALLPAPGDKVHDVGSLNVITNIEGGPADQGDKIDLKNSDLNSNEIMALMGKMFTGSPLFAIDVEVFGPQSNYSSILSLAAAPVENGTNDYIPKNNAIKELIESAVWLTDGAFPSDYPINEIFVSDGIMVPIGKWTDVNGAERDIRDVDLAFITAQANPNESKMMRDKWVLSNMPKSLTGMDPFTSKIEIISKLLPDAKITGKAARMTFTGKFINTLTSACAQAGLETRMNVDFNEFNPGTNMNIIGGLLSNGAINQNVSNFAVNGMQNNNFNTFYSPVNTMGKFTHY